MTREQLFDKIKNDPMSEMLRILAEPANTESEIRSRGMRAVNAGRAVPFLRSRGKCLHGIRLDRACEVCGRMVCRHGVGMHTSCPHCAAESDASFRPAWTRFLPNGLPRDVQLARMADQTAGEIMKQASSNEQDNPIVKVLFNGHEVTKDVLAVDLDKGEILYQESNEDPRILKGRVEVIRQKQDEKNE